MVFEPHIPEPKYASISSRAAALACHRLGLPPVELRFFRESDAEPVKNGRQRGQPWQDSPYLKGICSQRLLSGETDVWIRSGLSEKQLCITVAHELYHFYENTKYLPTDEDKAEQFGHEIWQEMTAPRNEWVNHLYFQ